MHAPTHPRTDACIEGRLRSVERCHKAPWAESIDIKLPCRLKLLQEAPLVGCGHCGDRRRGSAWSISTALVVERRRNCVRVYMCTQRRLVLCRPERSRVCMRCYHKLPSRLGPSAAHVLRHLRTTNTSSKQLGSKQTQRDWSTYSITATTWQE